VKKVSARIADNFRIRAFAFWKPEFASAIFPIIPVTSKCSLWFGVPVTCPASLSLILAVAVTHFILVNNNLDLI